MGDSSFEVSGDYSAYCQTGDWAFRMAIIAALILIPCYWYVVRRDNCSRHARILVGTLLLGALFFTFIALLENKPGIGLNGDQPLLLTLLGLGVLSVLGSETLHLLTGRSPVTLSDLDPPPLPLARRVIPCRVLSSTPASPGSGISPRSDLPGARSN